LTRVFLGGSRKIFKLNNPVKERLKNILDNHFTVLIGDANGADKAFQLYLKENDYKSVIVYCSGNICRNNIGNWNSVKIGNDTKNKNLDFYMLKDKEMAEQAEYGFMVWDGKSTGTLNNILNLLSLQKKSLIYFSPLNKLYTISNLENLSNLLKGCNDIDLLKIDKKINYKKRMDDMKLIQYELIN